MDDVSLVAAATSSCRSVLALTGLAIAALRVLTLPRVWENPIGRATRSASWE